MKVLDVDSLYPDNRWLFDHAPVGYLISNAAGETLLINKTLQQWLGFPAEALLRKKWVDVLLGQVGRAYFETHIGPLLQVRNEVRDLSIDLLDTNKSRVAMLMSVTKDIAAEGGLLIRYSFIKAADRILIEQQLLSAKHQAEDASERLRELAADLEKMVEQRTAELTAAYNDLDSFTFTVSHDLRAPLRVVNGYCNMLTANESVGLDDASKTYVVKIQQAVHLMNSMIDGLLQLAMGARAEIHGTTVDVSALAERICMEHQNEQGSSVVRWTVQAGLYAYADSRLMEVVLHNLIGNAWKYSARVACPMIDISGEDNEHERIIRVTDNGVGFDMGVVDSLFQPFKRLPSGQPFPGIGIGLSTVKRIVERHHGHVFARSTQGRGSTFGFALPKSERETSNV